MEIDARRVKRRGRTRWSIAAAATAAAGILVFQPTGVAEQATGQELAEYTAKVGTLGGRALAMVDADRCTVRAEDLRSVVVSYMGFDGRTHQGELVAAKAQAQALARLMKELYTNRVAIERIELPSRYKDADEARVANNTSAYSCQDGSDTGRSVSINPVQNPRVTGGAVNPPVGRDYLERGARKGVITDTGAFGDAGYKAVEGDYGTFRAKKLGSTSRS